MKRSFLVTMVAATVIGGLSAERAAAQVIVRDTIGSPGSYGSTGQAAAFLYEGGGTGSSFAMSGNTFRSSVTGYVSSFEVVVSRTLPNGVTPDPNFPRLEPGRFYAFASAADFIQNFDSRGGYLDNLLPVSMTTVPNSVIGAAVIYRFNFPADWFPVVAGQTAVLGYRDRGVGIPPYGLIQEVGSTIHPEAGLSDYWAWRDLGASQGPATTGSLGLPEQFATRVWVTSVPAPGALMLGVIGSIVALRRRRAL